jgi:hypothetical protein
LRWWEIPFRINRNLAQQQIASFPIEATKSEGRFHNFHGFGSNESNVVKAV